MAEKSAYAVLGLRKGCSEQEIKQTYLELVKKYDPERHTDRFMVIQSAYKRLQDTKKRAKEDVFTYNSPQGEFHFLPEEQVGESEDSRVREQYNKADLLMKERANDPQVRTAFLQLLMQRSFLSVGKKLWVEAIRDWSEVLRFDPTNIRARNNLIFAYVTLGHSYAMHGLSEEAAELWEKALQMNPDNADTIHNLAICYDQAKNVEKARKYWTETLKRWKQRLEQTPDDEYLKNCLIEVHQHFGGMNEGRPEPGSTSAPPPARTMGSGGSTSPGAGHQSSPPPSGGGGHGAPPRPAPAPQSQAPQQAPAPRGSAIDEYREILKLKGGRDFETQYHIAQMLMEQQKWEEASAEIQRILVEHGNKVDVLNLHGWALLNSGQVDNAFHTWRKSLALDPNNFSTKETLVRAHLSLGKKLRESGLFTPALVHFKQLVKYLGDDNPEVHMELGLTFDMKGDVRAAAFEYNRVITLDPKNKVARKALTDLKMKR